jgi:hypothetical protein
MAGESPLHSFLKKMGAAFLLNQGCFLVDTEVPLSRTGQTHELDDHRVVDVCGVGERFFEADGGALTDYVEDVRGRREVKRNVLRGVEVKVSRSDFRNGFYCSGCNYNYLLTPMRLVSPWELPRGVGLIEYNRYKFSVELAEERFAFRGLRVVKKASFRRVGQHQIDNATAHIVRRRHESDTEALLEELMEGHSENGYASP